MTIIINQRAYYYIIMLCALPSAFKPERSDRCQEFDDPNSLVLVYMYIILYIYIILAAVMAVYRVVVIG